MEFRNNNSEETGVKQDESDLFLFEYEKQEQEALKLGYKLPLFLRLFKRNYVANLKKG
jgi:hypothetical protein